MSTLCHENPFWQQNLRPERYQDVTKEERKRLNKSRKRLYQEWEAEHLPEVARGAHLDIPPGYQPLWVKKPKREKNAWAKVLKGAEPKEDLAATDCPF